MGKRLVMVKYPKDIVVVLNTMWANTKSAKEEPCQSKRENTYQFHIFSNFWHDSCLLLASKNASADASSSLFINVARTDSSKLFSTDSSAADGLTFKLTEALGLSASFSLFDKNHILKTSLPIINSFANTKTLTLKLANSCG